MFNIKAAVALVVMLSGVLLSLDGWADVSDYQKNGVKMGMAQEAPYALLSPDGQLTGASADITTAVFKEMGVNKVIPVVSDWGAIVPALQAKRLDLISTGLLINPQRCKALAFAEPDLCTSEAFAVLKGNPHAVNSYQDLKKEKLKIGVCGGCAEEKRALEVGVSRDDLVTVSDVFNGLEMLKAKRIDVLAWPDSTLNASITSAKETTVEVVAAAGEETKCSAVAFNSGNAALRDAYDVAFLKVKASGEFETIARKYGFNPALNSSASRESLCATTH
ncbi:ectoine/hydroxyectoine ABC transporter substrate-binding protein EhuB [Pseudomonas sp. dw_358]|uniref:ectoine/hydroxyectoine ABC transporter substrate-binding protein EhuB n=1 Tax=Pseudomonas sp. dw_358 TaxID=2720083 RepID=UPI001BD500D3|nr:ectoine/hydroxyectoine ABC transporter substrate-binding protein EhuB [Pseudomonas sp. dw_358]